MIVFPVYYKCLLLFKFHFGSIQSDNVSVLPTSK